MTSSLRSQPAAPTIGGKWRLFAALTVMGTLVTATSAGPYAFWLSALLWAVPPLVALRCLPWPLALVVVAITGVLGRALAFSTGLTGLDLLVVPLAATGALLPALVVDKLLVTRFPSAGIWAWPALVAATFVLLMGTPTGELVAPVPDLGGVHLVSSLHPAWAVAITGIVAQGFASMASVLNWHVPDPHPQAVRERGVRVATLACYALLAAFAIVELMF